jgi:hypothetical protein
MRQITRFILIASKTVPSYDTRSLENSSDEFRAECDGSETCWEIAQ